MTPTTTTSPRRKRAKALILSSICSLFALSFTTAHSAEDWPIHPISVVVPYGSGGAADLFGRIIALAMQPSFKQTIVVENRPGAGGNVGMAHVARSKPDGYTLGLGTIGTQSINEFLYKDMAYDPARDFVPIALVSTTPNVLAVSANSPWRTLGDVIKAAKQAEANGKVLTFGSPGVGSSVHLTGEYFQTVAGIKLLHVPFKGTANSLPAVASGQVDLLFDNLPGSVSQIKSGKLVHGIGQTALKRNPEAPDLPTFNETGLPGFDVTAWFALYAPKNTPQPIVDQLIAAAKKGLADPAIVGRITSMAAQPGTLFGPDLGKFEAHERSTWSKLITEKGITVQ